jgi:D-proline reductase (dithiol) PrdB
MKNISRIKNRILAIAATRIPAVAKKFIANYQPQVSTGEIPWCKPRKPLNHARLALVTTSGIHHKNQQPFDMQDPNGDPSFRELCGKSILHDYQITHDYYDHSDAHKDLNIIFPLKQISMLVDEKIIGSVAPTHYSLMGHIDAHHISTLVNKSAQDIAQKLLTEQVDIVLLTPA